MITTEAANIIRSAAMRNGIETDRELSRQTGIPPTSLSHKLLGQTRFSPEELSIIFVVCRMTDAEIVKIMKGGWK